ncbi:MAG: nitrite reductase, copper-containing, partial [Halobacteriaceae archaeon]
FHLKFKATYPGAFIYHCAVPNLDYHISSGMFGMIVVEPKEGLSPVDKEIYLGQHEVYTDMPVGKKGHHNFDFTSMKKEQPTYVLFNGEKYPFTPNRYGTINVNREERVRLFMVCGGPNYSSNFHPIGNVWAEGYRDGAIADRPEKYLQTAKVPPGSCFVGEMDTPVPERIKLVDHALTRVARRGLLAEIDVQGEEQPEVFDPSPDKPVSADEDGPLY